MEIIAKHKNAVSALFGDTKFVESAEYRLATFTSIVKYEGRYLLYNNLSKTLYLLTSNEGNAVKRIPIAEPALFDALIKDNTIVPIDFDDFSYINSAKKIYDCLPSRILRPNFVIFTTTKCNARCPYCFEHGQRRIDMSEQTAKDVARFIGEKAPQKAVTIKWFGGEPLYNMAAMDVICTELQKRGIAYTSKATTNGYLFDKNVIDHAINVWHLKSVVITLDGTREVYNQVKNYIYDDSDPFEVVINNIDNLLLSDINVSIRINVGFDNFENLKELLSFLNEHFDPFSKKPNIVPIALYDLEGSQTPEEREKLSAMIAEIEDLTERSANKITGLSWFSALGNRCLAEDDNTYLISPIGELGTCEHFSEGEMMYGSIYSDKENLEIKNYYKQRTITERCKTCALFPNCGGVAKCPTMTHGCDEIQQRIRLKALSDAMIVQYKKYLKKQAEAQENK